MKIKLLNVPEEGNYVVLQQRGSRLMFTESDARQLAAIIREAEEKPGVTIPSTAKDFDAMAVKKPAGCELHLLLPSESHIVIPIESFARLADALDSKLAELRRH